MRRKIIAGNWKMNMTTAQASSLVTGIIKELSGKKSAADVVVCPPFTSIKAAADAITCSCVALGAQNMHWVDAGAYTGEVSAPMLCDLGVKYVILGHSERRTYFGETDEIVNRKVKAALAAGLTPIVCVGETLKERIDEKTAKVVTTQVHGSLADLGAGLGKVVVAYEPVWAIGTGKTATSAQAQEVHAMIRKVLAGMSDEATAQTIRIQYGGSMNAANAAELLTQPDIDGGLIGGASLKVDSFAAIIAAAG
jgi:triosephosphate isomerase